MGKENKRIGGKRTKRRLRKSRKSRKSRKTRKSIKKKKSGGFNTDFSRPITKFTGMHKNIYSNIRHKFRNISREMEKHSTDIKTEIIQSNINDLNKLLDDNINYTNNDVYNCHPSIYSDKGNDGKSIYDLKEGIQKNIQTKLPSRYVNKTTQELEYLLLKIGSSDKNGCPLFV